MNLFSMVASHPEWGWLSDEERPWIIIDPKSNSGLMLRIADLAGGADSPDREGLDIDDSKGPVFVHDEAYIGPNVRIEGPSYVEAGAEIRHGAYLRPGSYVCNGCVVGHSSEIKNTLMMPGSKAPHFNYVGDSILGPNSNLGAGAKISNVRLDRGNVSVRFSNGSSMDTGMRKLGAMIGELSELGCNVVTNPGAVIPPSSAVPPNTSVTGYWGPVS
jgi:NDP-sugar pyrophosphorylase family protein